jgi:predicted nucleotidyltransferase
MPERASRKAPALGERSRTGCPSQPDRAARAQARAGSDLDIAVLLREPPPATVEGLAFEIGGEIERATGTPVDIVVLNRASPDLVHRVLRDGVLVHESDPRARVAFETRKRAEYFDVLPYLRQYRRSAARRGP